MASAVSTVNSGVANYLNLFQQDIKLSTVKKSFISSEQLAQIKKMNPVSNASNSENNLESPKAWDVENAVYGRCERSRIENTIETGPISQGAQGVYMKFVQDNKNNTEIMDDLWNKCYIDKLQNPVQAYFNEHNIDLKAEYNKYLSNSGVSSDEELQELNKTPYPTRQLLQGGVYNEVMLASLAAKDNAFISREESLTQEECQKIVSIADIKDLVEINPGGDPEKIVLATKNLMDKLVSNNNIDDKLKQKLTKISNSISVMTSNGTWGTAPNANMQRYNSSLISKYAS